MQGYSSESMTAAGDVLARLNKSATRHTLDFQGCATVWREWGSGPALLLIHGGHGSWMHWAKNIDALAQHFRVIAPDLPGFGDSADFDSPPHDPNRLTQLLDCLVDGVDQLVGDDPVFLTGFSFGGVVAGSLAPRLRHLQRLALLGCAGHGTERRETEPLSDWRAVQGTERERALLQNLQVFMLSTKQSADALALEIHARSCEMTRFRSKGISRGRALSQTLKTLDKPVMLVWGDADVTAMPAQAGEILAQGDPQKTWQIVEGAGHWVQYEKADEINALLTHWFNTR